MSWNEVKIIDGKKPCPACGRDLPTFCFATSAALKCGFRSECRECRTRKNRIGYKKIDRRVRVVDGKKHCSTCKRNLPVSCFYKRVTAYSGLSCCCKECKGKRKKKYLCTPKGRKKSRESAKRDYYKNKTERNLARCDRSLKRLYGITLAEYDEMFEKQNGVCAICSLPELTRRLCIDHCHKTDKVRSLLCSRCNSILGQVEENQETLESMITYLERHRVKNA